MDINTSIDTNTQTNNFIKSRRRTSFKEFTLIKELRPEVKAGFRAWLKGTMFLFDDEWERKYDEYCNRKLERRRI